MSAAVATSMASTRLHGTRRTNRVAQHVRQHPQIRPAVQADILLATDGYAWAEVEGSDKAVAADLGITRQTLNKRRLGTCASWVSSGLRDCWRLEAAGKDSLPLLAPFAVLRRTVRMRRLATAVLWDRLADLARKEERIAAEVNQLQLDLLDHQEIPAGFGRAMLRQAVVSLQCAAISVELWGRGALRRRED